MIRLLLLVSVSLQLSLPFAFRLEGGETKGESAPALHPLRAEKPYLLLPRDPGDDAPRERVLCGSDAASRPPSKLFLRVKKFHEEGGQPWIELGVENTVASAIEHLIEEHGFTRADLIGYDLITLNWIHGMAHEWGHPEPSEQQPDAVADDAAGENPADAPAVENRAQSE
jgi:hypothetical protein